jgi:hypothetical protein
VALRTNGVERCLSVRANAEHGPFSSPDGARGYASDCEIVTIAGSNRGAKWRFVQ